MSAPRKVVEGLRAIGVMAGGPLVLLFAALAAVRFALIEEPSMKAYGLPVSSELRTTTAEARSSPLRTLSGNDETHFIPATSKSPPR